MERKVSRNPADQDKLFAANLLLQDSHSILTYVGSQLQLVGRAQQQ